MNLARVAQQVEPGCVPESGGSSPSSAKDVRSETTTVDSNSRGLGKAPCGYSQGEEVQIDPWLHPEGDRVGLNISAPASGATIFDKQVALNVIRVVFIVGLFMWGILGCSRDYEPGDPSARVHVRIRPKYESISKILGATIYDR